MKTACSLALLLGAAQAVAPPKISLSLDESMLHDSIEREHDLGYTNVDHSHYRSNVLVKNTEQKRIAVKSRQDWTQKCAAGRNTFANCPFPKASAWDFVDHAKVDVQTRIFLVDDADRVMLQPEELNAEGCGAARFTNPAGCGIKMNKRSTYLFKYDAMDNAGNHAEQVVFALILDDPDAPKIILNNKDYNKVVVSDEKFFHNEHKLLKHYFGQENYNQYVTSRCWQFTNPNCDVNTQSCTMEVEASRHPTWGLLRCTDNKGVIAVDGIDGDVTKSVRYSAKDATGQHIVNSNGVKLYHVGPEAITEYFKEWTRLGDFKLEIHANDKAGVYGKDSLNNLKTVSIDIHVDDKLPPQIFVHGVNKPTLECNRDVPYQWCTEQQKQDAFENPVYKPKYICDRGAGAFDELDGDLGEIPKKNYSPNPDLWANMQVGTNIKQGPTSFTVTYEVADKLGQSATATRELTIQDTTAPTVALVGDADLHNHADKRQTGETQCRRVAHSANKNGDHVYPTGYHSVCAHSAGNNFYDQGIDVDDTCDADLGARTDLNGRNGIYAGIACPANDANVATDASGAKDCWGGKVFDLKKVGKYIRTYTIQDASKNLVTVYRTFHNVDMTAPIITLLGKAKETFEASRDVEYTDQGARCSDYVDGDISHNVEVSGEIVNMKVPGTYNLQYDCQDNNGNIADQIYRSIVIEDTQCPHITLNGQKEVVVEAGFPYKDAGATATDDLDGDITDRVRSVGNTVDTAESFYYAKSCKEIKTIAANYPRTNANKFINVAKVNVQDGQYYITTSTTFNGQTKSEAVVVTCDFESETTFFPLNANRAKHGNDVTLTAATLQEDKFVNTFPTCEEYGFVPFTNPTAEQKDFAKQAFPTYDLVVPAGMQSDMRLCTKAASEETTDSASLMASIMPQLRASKAASLSDPKSEVGEYVIKYYVHDLANNGQCAGDFPTRTVKVVDSLPPVLTLKYKGQVLNKNVPTAHATRNAENPAEFKVGTFKTHIKEYAHYGNPQFGLMAEATTTNGWLIAAVASGIAGVALFSYSLKKTTVTTVPV